ncbi:MAG TPA: prolyl-tRNA synthetase associated domain-containing protein [Candidatus Limivivens merdigallinarum]|uniref:Prolyl-tRNA synthetase associated domain-containing protein n=1 Tax=Candidatus Limivivens merdigallinarum TaxID=2840859 RepID=A0A9D0ZVQ4_9FIRM|nr:prolyl-tRNA synthetase associated domain-containing protein [Candidatus Limivivens merdigallinarum]
MKKQEVYEYLNRRGIRYEITEHEAIFDMKAAAFIDQPYPEADAKNLFLRDDKKQNYYLLTVKGDKKVNLKEFQKNNCLRHLSFAPETDLMDILGLIPGAVTPLGILNDRERKVHVFLDRALFAAPGLIGVHPNDNTATVWMRTEDLKGLIEEHGNPISITAF